MRSILYILILGSLFSCGIFKKVRKEKSLSKMETSISTRSDSTGLIIDKSVIIVKEKMDTVIKVPGKTFQQDTYLNMDSLINGMTAVKNDLIDIRLHLNPITNILSTTATLKPSSLPVAFDRETIRQNDIVNSGSKTHESNQESKQLQENNVIDKEPKNNSWFTLMIWGVVAIVIFAVYRYFKR